LAGVAVAIAGAAPGLAGGGGQETAPPDLAIVDPALAAAASAAEAEKLRARLPPGAADMIDTAVRARESDRLDAVVAVAKETWPKSADDISAYAKLAKREEKEIRYSKVAQAGFFSYWTGHLSVGGATATGNSNSNNYVISASLQKDGPRWLHRANFDLNYSLSGDDDPTKRASGAWQSNYKLDEKRFIYGRFGYLKNFSAGIRNRFIESVGVGTRFAETPRLTWDMALGPAARQTQYYDGSQRDGFALRFANRGVYKLTKAVTLSNENSVYVASDATLDNTTKLTTNLTDRLTTTIAFNVQWEKEPAPTYAETSTLSSITIGYDF
jgi:putative salt-induced outer membrane protein